MRISGVQSGIHGRVAREPRDTLAPIPASHALVATPNTSDTADRAMQRPPRVKPAQGAAPFLAHLIATAEHMPQTRMRRRAAPADACVAYARTQAARPLEVFG